MSWQTSPEPPFRFLRFMHHRKLEGQAFVSKGYQNDILGWHQVDNHHSFLLSPGDPNALTSSFQLLKFSICQKLSLTFSPKALCNRMRKHWEIESTPINMSRLDRPMLITVDLCIAP